MLATFPAGILSKFPHAKFLACKISRITCRNSIQLGLMMLLTLKLYIGVKATQKEMNTFGALVFVTFFSLHISLQKIKFVTLDKQRNGTSKATLSMASTIKRSNFKYCKCETFCLEALLR